MPLTLGNFLGMTDTRQTSQISCSCPACTGLNCLERPRFFAGQLISEAELNSEIDYMLAKQRLHNRYLHGVGTVCGLEVVCSNCEGQVIVKPGYAIDPCGNDIIVCTEQRFDLLKAIKACCDSRKKKCKTDCDPYLPAGDPGCTGLEQHWCITITYQEKPTRPTTPLRNQPKSCGCGGSCGGSCGCSCGSGNGNGKSAGNSCSTTSSSSSSATTTALSCEPTRVLESFQLGVVEDTQQCDTAQALFGNTLFARILECFMGIAGFSTKISSTSSQLIGEAITGKLASSQASNTDAFAACCQFRQYVIDLFSNGEFDTECQILKVFDEVKCQQPPSQGTGATVGNLGSAPQYLQAIQDTISKIFIALIEYFRECVCHQLLPPCLADPADDRLILACVTIKNGKIIDICNFNCRKFAGAFPSFFYWLSIVPIVPLIRSVIDSFCCGPAFLRRNSPLVNEMEKIDPAGGLQRALAEGNFALPRMLLERFGDFMQKFSLDGIINSIPAGGLNLATLRGMSVGNAQESLKSFGVSYDERKVNSRAEIPVFPRVMGSPMSYLLPFAQRGDNIILYHDGTTVLEVQPSVQLQNVQSADVQSNAQDVSALRKQVESLQAEVDKLKKASSARKK
jgi:hypothetical protein